MTAQQRELHDRLFGEAVTLPPEQQARFLAESCLDPEVRAELESLLGFFAEGPLETVEEVIAQTVASVAETALIGQRAGPYRITGRIGQGGMGAVYRAVRVDEQFQQTVALKMLRFVQSDPADVQRFRRERQILATLEHPHITRLLDGGSWIPPGATEDQPYIVMEYVEGLPLTVYCRQNTPRVRERLLLFQQVCEAVSYAHQRLVIHRDIKPSNILVTADGTSKLLDFGIAKLLDTETETGAMVTVTLWRAMTPDYASPEQVRGEPVSTATDVYSLGAVLYELLTGRRPHHFATRDPSQVVREICESDVAPPGVDPDLDVIVSKAIQKDASRRYQSVEQMSEDIRRYLQGLPIMARPETVAYRAAKFVRRHRFGVAAAAAVFFILVSGVTVSTWEARRADMQAATAMAISEFLQKDLLAQASARTQAGPNTKPDSHLEVRTALDRAAARIGGKFAKQPLVEASIRQTIGSTYKDLGLYSEAQREVERALDLRRRIRGELDRETLQSLYVLAELFLLQGKYPQAMTTFTQALNTQRRVLGPENPETLNTMRELAGVYQRLGKYAEAEPLYTTALQGQQRVLGGKHIDVASTMNDLALLYNSQSNYAQAERLYSGTLEIIRQLKGEEDPDTLTVMLGLGLNYVNQNKYEQAAPLIIKVLEVRRRVLGEEHPDTLQSMVMLSGLYRDEGKYEEAEALYTTSQEVRRRVLGEEHPDTLTAAFNLAQLYRIEGKYREAEALYNRILAVDRRVLGPEHPRTLTVGNSLADLYRRQRRYEEAARLCRTVLEVRRRVLGAQHRDTMVSLALLGLIRLDEKKYADAEPPLREAVTGYAKTAPDDWRRFRAQSLLGASLAGQQKFVEAEPLLIEGYQGMLQRLATIPADNRSHLEDSGHSIVQLYRDLGKLEQAVDWEQRIRTSSAAERH